MKPRLHAALNFFLLNLLTDLTKLSVLILKHTKNLCIPFGTIFVGNKHMQEHMTMECKIKINVFGQKYSKQAIVLSYQTFSLKKLYVCISGSINSAVNLRRECARQLLQCFGKMRSLTTCRNACSQRVGLVGKNINVSKSQAANSAFWLVESAKLCLRYMYILRKYKVRSLDYLISTQYGISAHRVEKKR